MKKCTLSFLFFLSLYFSFSQTVYIPNGTGGITNSSNSNIGIGTNWPDKKFTVFGDVRLASDGLGGGFQRNGLLIQNSGTRTELRWQHFGQNTNPYIAVDPAFDAAKLLFGTNGSDQMVLQSNGNVGIGTTSPLSPLHIRSSINRTLRLDKTNVPNGSYTWQALETNSVEQWRIVGRESDNAGLEFWNKNSDNVLSLMQNGNIGIGATNPSEKLDLSKWMSYNVVNDSGIKLGNLNETSVNNHKSHSYTLKTFGDANGIRLGIVQQSRIRNEVEVLSILNDNVGIGTKAPDMKLTVKGNIHAEEVKIDLNVPAPDYVFKEGYMLRSIEEVERFVQENNHLPEIPSAAEFKQNGVMLAEMDMNLLKKIEELTLYTIQQEKKIKKLEEENQKLKSLSNRLSKIEKLLLKAKK